MADAIKVRLGNEGMWAWVGAKTKRLHDTDASGVIGTAKLANDSIFYPKAKVGTAVKLTMYADRKPDVIIPASWESTETPLPLRRRRNAVKRTLKKKNPLDPVQLFAQGASGILSALQIHNMVTKKPKRRGKTTAKTNKRRSNPTAAAKKPNPSMAARMAKIRAARKVNSASSYARGTTNVRPLTDRDREQLRAIYAVAVRRADDTGKKDTGIRAIQEHLLDGDHSTYNRAVRSTLARFRKNYKVKKKRNPVKAQRPKTKNPKAATVKTKGGSLYLLTIRRGDDELGYFLHDGSQTGHKEFKTLAAARAHAKRRGVKLVENPAVKIIRKRNVDGFVDEAGVFHPIRSSADYSGHAAGDYKSAPRKRADSKTNLIAAARKAKDRGTYNRAMNKYKELVGHTANTKPKAFPAFKQPNPKPNGILSRALARRRAASELKRELRAEAKLERIRSRKAKAIKAATKNPAQKQKEYRVTGVWRKTKTKAECVVRALTARQALAHANKKNSQMGRSLGLASVSWKKAVVLNPAKPVAKARKNPRTTARRRTFEMFQGRRATTAKPMAVSHLAPKGGDVLGSLIELKIAGGPALKFNGGVKLVASHGKLWIAGKRFAKPNPGTAANVINPIGEIDHVVYATHKPHHGDHNLTHYIHKLGEESGRRPILCVDREGYPVIRGGNYKIESRGIVD